MSFSASLALFSAMIILALIPGPGMLTVISHALSAGMKHGFIAVLGVLTGDFIYIAVAIIGLSALSHFMGEYFFILQLVGASYLFWLAYQLWQQQQALSLSPNQQKKQRVAKRHSYVSGLIITLGNPKAVFFYLGFFPAFVDLNTLTSADIVLILMITIVAIGGVLSGYALIAVKAIRLLKTQEHHQRINRVASVFIAFSGIFILFNMSLGSIT